MVFSIEWTQGTGRYYEKEEDVTSFGEYYSVLTLTRIGPETVLVSADLSKKPLTRKDIIDLINSLKKEGFLYLHCWRSSSKTLPFRLFRSHSILATHSSLTLYCLEL